MKSICVGLGILLLATASSYAAEAWKEATVNGTKIYTDARGMTLYTYDKDSKGKSDCYDKCAKNWPPLKASANAKAMGGWSVIKRKNGSHMWAYDGKPVYTFAKDKKAGDISGDGIGEVWHMLKAD